MLLLLIEFLGLQTVDDVGSLAGDVARIGGVGTACYVSYRVVTKAYRDAHEVQKETVEDLETRRARERAEHLEEKAAWVEERAAAAAREAQLLSQVDVLQATVQALSKKLE